MAGCTPYQGSATDACVIKINSLGSIEWMKRYGGSDQDIASCIQQTNDGGYIFVGRTNSYGVGYSDVWLVKLSSAGVPQWNRTYGTDFYDSAYSVQETKDGGYIVAGSTQLHNGRYVYWLIKTDANGYPVWTRTYGSSSSSSEASLAQQTTDGGYIVAGWTSTDSKNYYVWLLKTDDSGNVQWNKTCGRIGSNHYGFIFVPERMPFVQQTKDGGFITMGDEDPILNPTLVWVLKTNESGYDEWKRTYEGADYCQLWPVRQTEDEGYIMAGGAYSSGTGFDFWLLKTNSTGDLQWEKTYGGGGSDYAYSVLQTSDAGYTVMGTTESFGFATDLPFFGDANILIVKTDAYGTTQWMRTYGGGVHELRFSTQQTADGGYIAAGTTNSFGSGGCDFWLIKTDSSGGIQWNKTYGGPLNEYAFCVQQTTDAGYIVAGATTSYGSGDSDFWLVKTDSEGEVQWSYAYGGIRGDTAFSAQQTSDGGFIAAGVTWSFGSSGDFWVVKTDPDGVLQWSKTYDLDWGDGARSVQQTSDGGYIVVGYSTNEGATLLVKTYQNGSVEWSRIYGGRDIADSRASFVTQTSDHGYMIAGWIVAIVDVYATSDAWLMKTDSVGNVLLNATYDENMFDHVYSAWETSDGYVLGGDAWASGLGDTQCLMLRTYSNGTAQWKWNATLYWTTSRIFSVEQTSDKGYIATVLNPSYDLNTGELFLVKFSGSTNGGGGTNPQGPPIDALAIIVIALASAIPICLAVAAARWNQRSITRGHRIKRTSRRNKSRRS